MSKDNEASVPAKCPSCGSEIQGTCTHTWHYRRVEREPATVAREPETATMTINAFAELMAETKKWRERALSAEDKFLHAPSVEPAAQTQPTMQSFAKEMTEYDFEPSLELDKDQIRGLTRSQSNSANYNAEATARLLDSVIKARVPEEKYQRDVSEPAVEERVGAPYREWLLSKMPTDIHAITFRDAFEAGWAARASSGTGQEVKIFQHHVNCSCLPTKPIGSPNCMCRVEFGAGDALGVDAAPSPVLPVPPTEQSLTVAAEAIVRRRWLGDLDRIPFGKVCEFMASFAEDVYRLERASSPAVVPTDEKWVGNIVKRAFTEIPNDPPEAAEWAVKLALREASAASAELIEKVKQTRTAWLEQHGIPISHEFANFAEAVGNLCNYAAEPKNGKA